MIRLSVMTVQEEHRAELLAWLKQLDGPRRTEALATLVDEGCRHETALLVETSDGPLLVYAMEVEDEDRSRSAAEHSPHAIDAEHRVVMQKIVGARPTQTKVLDVYP